LETRILQLDDSYAHYAQAGEEGPAIIILHGWAASLKQWEWLLPILAKAGYTAYAVDLLGHGQSPRISNDHTIEDYLEHVCRWMTALDIRHPIFLGHSMGGYLSIQYALDHPGAVRGLVLVDPLYGYHQFYIYHQFARRLFGRPEMLKVGEFVYRLAPTWLIEASYYWGPPDVGIAPATLRQQVTLDHKRADPHIIQTIAIIGDLRPRLGQVTVPALITWGCRDQLLSPDSFETLVDLLPAAQGHCFADVGHHPHLSRSQSFIELVLGFLKELEGNWKQMEVSSDGATTRARPYTNLS
jgi:pimeloyl-ACP methyl ester carboxylesterase